MTGSSRPAPSLLVESGLALTRASLEVKFAPFARLMLRLPGRIVTRQVEPRTVATIIRALDAWSRRMPWRTLCFERGLAAFRMLARRGFQATLYYGAAQIDGELKAHVWVRSGDLDVVGCENAGDFAILSCFSNDSSSSSVQP